MAEMIMICGNLKVRYADPEHADNIQKFMYYAVSDLYNASTSDPERGVPSEKVNWTLVREGKPDQTGTNFFWDVENEFWRRSGML